MVDPVPDSILALDLSTRVGWAYGAPARLPAHGVMPLGTEAADLGRRFALFADGLADLITLHNPARIVMEAPLPPMGQTHAHTARIQIGLAAVTELICHRREIECAEAAAQTVRKDVLQSGRASKAEIIHWCRSQGWTPRDDNAADALVLLVYALRAFAPNSRPQIKRSPTGGLRTGERFP